VAAAAASARHEATARGGAHKTRLSHLAIALIALAALLVVCSVAWAWARWNTWEPRWWVGLRHSFAEGGYHASAGWAELRDWARLGR